MIKVNTREEFLDEVGKLLNNYIDAVEIGVYNGDFSQQILDRLKPWMLVLIDPFTVNEEYYPGEAKQPTAYSNNDNYEIVWNKFKRNQKVFIDRSYSYDAVRRYEGDSFEFIYHDASHMYEDLKRDLNDWLPKLAFNGLMCGHDYTGNYSDHVIKAVDEFCAEHNFGMIILNENGGDFALKRCTAS